MEDSTSSMPRSSSQKRKPVDTQQIPQETDEARKALKVLARFILSLPRGNNSYKDQVDQDEHEGALVDKNCITSKKSILTKGFNGSKKTRNPKHNSLLDQRAEIQYLVDFHSSRIQIREFPSDPFSKHREVFTNYQLIMLDKEPVTKLVLCSKCRKVLVRYRPSGTNLIRHYQRHMKIEEEKQQAQRQSSKRMNAEFRKHKIHNFPKVIASKDKSNSKPRIGRNDLPSGGNDRSMSTSSLTLSGLDNQQEARNKNPGRGNCSLPADNAAQDTSKGDSNEGIVKLFDHPIPIIVGVGNTKDKTCAEITMIEDIESSFTQGEGFKNRDQDPCPSKD